MTSRRVKIVINSICLILVAWLLLFSPARRMRGITTVVFTGKSAHWEVASMQRKVLTVLSIFSSSSRN